MEHERWMRRCLDLARMGVGETAPNPMVGCVIVHNGRIIGEGYHRHYGGPHAEVNAIESVTEKALLPESVMYVNLEPCVHYGKTPPCVERILAERISHVVIGSADPNPKVSGQGIARLRAAGCRVTEGIMTGEAERLNIRFMTFYRMRRPFVLLKWAQTADGFIDVKREQQPARPTWITGDYERVMVHKWRSEEMAIMVGTNTALMDNPMLNIRHWTGRDPLRIVLDRQLRLPLTLLLFDGSQPTLIFTESHDKPLSHMDYETIPFDAALPQHILDSLYRRGITSVMIEGGARLLETFIDAGLWDEARVFIGQMRFTQGVAAPVFDAVPTAEETLPNSVLRRYFRKM